MNHIFQGKGNGQTISVRISINNQQHNILYQRLMKQQDKSGNESTQHDILYQQSITGS